MTNFHSEPDASKRVEVTSRLTAMGMKYTLHNNGMQIQVKPYNYYPTTGTITKDGGPKISSKGMTEFIKLVLSSRQGLVPAPVKRPAPRAPVENQDRNQPHGRPPALDSSSERPPWEE